MRRSLVITTGIILVLFSGVVILSEPAVAQNTIREGLCSGAELELDGSGCERSGGIESFEGLIRRIINLLSVIVGVVAVVMIIIGGLRYITSGGSDTGVTGAKNTILYAIIGLIIVAMAQLIVRIVLNNLAGVD